MISNKKIFALDSTSFILYQPIFECFGQKTNSRKLKVGIKIHQKLDFLMGIAVKIYNNQVSEHDSIFI